MNTDAAPADSDNEQDYSPDSAPSLIIFDVNETLSDMSPMGARFADVGAPPQAAATWFASLLRDGFALTVTGRNPTFADLAAEGLRGSLHGQVDDVQAAVEHIMKGFSSLEVHPDIVEGVQTLHRLGITLVTLSNGATTVAQGLLQRSGIEGLFERLLSVESGPLWKPAASAYQAALDATGVEASDAMLVAVHPWDIHGAHEAGLRTAWINRTGAAYPGYFQLPDLQATSLVDLAAQLGGIGG
jgi:2-haloacid dehalogenase